ncbi:glycosyltransferase [Thiolapillus sp.]
MKNSAVQLKVLHVTNMWPTPDKPHYGAFVKAQVTSLEKAGVLCKIIIDSKTPGVKKYLSLRTLTNQAIKEFKPDVIHAHFGWTAAALAPTNIPLVVSFCGGDLNGESGGMLRRVKYSLGRQLSIMASRRSAHNIVKSRMMLQYLPENHLGKTSIIPNGVDMELFSDMDRKQAKIKMGWEAGKIVLFAGRPDDPTKNFKLAESAVELAKKLVPDLALKSPKGINHSDMPIPLNAADLLLITSKKEGSPNIVKEALSCNLPVIAVPVGDLEWLLEGLQCSIVCKYDAKEISAAIIKLFNNNCPSRSEGRKKLLDMELDSALVARKLINIYEQVSQPNH